VDEEMVDASSATDPSGTSTTASTAAWTSLVIVENFLGTRSTALAFGVFAFIGIQQASLVRVHGKS
jgi:hypothetical protein